MIIKKVLAREKLKGLANYTFYVFKPKNPD